jgi:hypothetical protein
MLYLALSLLTFLVISDDIFFFDFASNAVGCRYRPAQTLLILTSSSTPVIQILLPVLAHVHTLTFGSQSPFTLMQFYLTKCCQLYTAISREAESAPRGLKQGPRKNTSFSLLRQILLTIWYTLAIS